MRKTLFTSFVSILCGMLFLTSAAYAGTITTVSGTLLSPESTPIEGMAVQLFQEGVQVSYAVTDSSGVFTFSYLTDGEYTVTFSPIMSYGCSSCALYQEQSQSITIDSTTYGLDAQNLGSYTMVAAERYVTIVVTDQDSLPVEGAMVSAWGGSSYAYGTTDSEGNYSFAWNDDTVSFGVYPSAGGFTSTYQYEIPVNDSGETSIAASVETTDATIVITLKDSDGVPYTLTESEYAAVYCTSISESEGEESTTGKDGTTAVATASTSAYFNGSIIGGESSVTLGVVAGTYSCGAWLNGYGVHVEGTATVASDESVSIDVTLLAYDASISFEYIDQDGNVITDIDSFSVYGSSTKDSAGNDYFQDYIWGQGADGVATLQALDGFTYEIGSWFDSSSSAGSSSGTTEPSTEHGDEDDDALSSKGVLHSASTGKNYIQTYTTTSVVASINEPQTVQVTLQEADATLEVLLLDSAGNPSPYGWVSANESADLSDIEDTATAKGWSNYVGGMADENGVATLALVSGTPYTVSAWTNTAHDGSALPPAHQNVTLESGETESITMQESVTDWTLNITTTDGANAEETTFDYSYCYAYSPSLGLEAFASMNGTSGSMGVVRGGEWYIGCMAYVGDVFYRSTDLIYTPGDEANGSDDLNITLQDAGEYYGETSYSIPATSTTTITLPDGVSTLTIPANAVSDTGNITLTVQTATGYAVDDKHFPVSAYEFSVLDSNGEAVTEFSSNLTLKLAYTEEALAEWGIDESALTGGSYGDNNNWESPVSTSVDTEGNFLVITLNHFSAYAIIADLDVEEAIAPSKARHLKARQIKKQQALLDWKQPAGDDTVTAYTIQLRKYKVKNTAKYRTFTDVAATRRLVKKLKAGKHYEFRVQACNASSCSDWTKWNDFTTKE